MPLLFRSQHRFGAQRIRPAGRAIDADDGAAAARAARGGRYALPRHDRAFDRRQRHQPRGLSRDRDHSGGARRAPDDAAAAQVAARQPWPHRLDLAAQRPAFLGWGQAGHLDARRGRRLCLPPRTARRRPHRRGAFRPHLAAAACRRARDDDARNAQSPVGKDEPVPGRALRAADQGRAHGHLPRRLDAVYRARWASQQQCHLPLEPG